MYKSNINNEEDYNNNNIGKTISCFNEDVGGTNLTNASQVHSENNINKSKFTSNVDNPSITENKGLIINSTNLENLTQQSYPTLKKSDQER